MYPEFPHKTLTREQVLEHNSALAERYHIDPLDPNPRSELSTERIAANMFRLINPTYAEEVRATCERLDAVYYPSAKAWFAACERNQLTVIEAEFGYQIDSIVKDAGWLNINFPPDGFIKRVVLQHE